MIRRTCKLSKSNSFFLFGPRGVGKTTLVSEVFAAKKPCVIDLLDAELFDQLTLDPARFKQIIDSPQYLNVPVVIDEVQKLPRLLDVVHSQIQKRKRQFILTGSSS
jgi:predicted AAA+ superfamily ATPase